MTSPRKALFYDSCATWIIRGGGILVITATVGILVLITATALPLFQTPTVQPLGKLSSSAPIIAAGSDNYLKIVYAIDRHGNISFGDADDFVLRAKHKLRPQTKAVVMSEESVIPFHHTLIWDDGRVTLIAVSPAKRQTQIVYQHQFSHPPKLAMLRKKIGAVIVSSVDHDDRLTVKSYPLAEEEEDSEDDLFAASDDDLAPLAFEHEFTAVTTMDVTTSGDKVVLGTATGQIALIDAREARVVTARNPLPVSAVGFVYGDSSFIVGDTAGNLAAWQETDGLVQYKTFAGLSDEVSKIVKARRGKLFASFSSAGEISVDFLTNSRRILHLSLAQPRTNISLSPRDNALIVVGKGRELESGKECCVAESGKECCVAESGKECCVAESGKEGGERSEGELQRVVPPLCDPPLCRQGRQSERNKQESEARSVSSELAVWKFDAPHPETSLNTLLGKVWYESHVQPAFVWQSSGGSDDFEAKLSLTPLIFGTFKGTLYAMLLVLPLAVFGAVYVNQFASRKFKNVIKPAVEILASLPSVVIGFLAALWLAPFLQSFLVTFFLSWITLPVVFLLFVMLWLRLQGNAFRASGYEFVLLVPVVLLGFVAAYYLTAPVEKTFFQGDFIAWLYDNIGIRYDQRNSIVIAFGLGFAVMPIIFSLTEDSLASIPSALPASSLALGASRWQTVWRVVLPSASPGIFAAAIIGFGRAIGETMIVLMATGNTPIIDASPFNGMRTLAANIAVEVPEAAVDSTLYRTLFLCAVVLFGLTFFFNTVAELIRTSLRSRYGRF